MNVFFCDVFVPYLEQFAYFKKKKKKKIGIQNNNFSKRTFYDQNIFE